MSEYGTIQKDILPRCHFLVEARTELDHRRDLAAHLHRALIRLQDPGDRLQQRTLARAVGSDQAPGLPLLHMEVDILQRQELLKRQLMLQPLDRILLQVIHLDVAKVEPDGKMIHIDNIRHKDSL